MLRFFAVAIVVATPAAMLAQASDTTRLPRVVVTATKVDSRIGSGIASVTILNGDSLRDRGIHDLAEALRDVPGATIVRSGSFGAQTSLFLRGGESDYVRVLVDGVPVNNPGGSIDLTLYTLDNVERIEIVRGPASVLYGSDAVTGVIQIFTRQQAAARSIDAGISGGTYGTRSGDASLGVSSGPFSATAGVARRLSDGILAFNNDYQNDALSGQVTLAAGSGSRISLSGRQQRDEFHYPTDGGGALVDRNAFRTERRSSLALDAEQPLGTRLRIAVTLSALEGRPRTDDASDGPADTAGFHAYRSAGTVRRRVADTRMNVLLPQNAIATLGSEWQREAQHGRDSSNFDAAPNAFGAERTTRATYAQLVGEAGRLSYTLGGRYDDNDVFGIFRTARVGVALKLTPTTSVRANGGSAFKAPTFLEQFNTAFTVGNPTLRPERARSIEIGAVQQLANGGGEISATWFSQRFRDLIQYSFVSVTTPNYFNVAAASARGLELEGQARLRSTRLAAAVTFLRTRVDDAGFDRGENATFVRGNRLLRRPSVTGSLTASSHLTPRTTVDARLLVVGSRDDRNFSGFPATPVILDSYRRLDAGVAYRLTDGAVRGPTLTLFVRAENLLDGDYEEIVNFAAPGRVVSLGLRAAAGR